ncbi:hypothetical protein DICVIV_03805 [Dictyocaulus viviparus]|uniref:phosphoribosylformylglycinamidine cyclo-ligase n=1 Tax=Dictyocaulus viviparus TaxID=29172 RepID=A0A0D8XZI9_DICVI|nr:hypothetical protein DICVIV_03805 [Dictyocaulus viviparus]
MAASRKNDCENASGVSRNAQCQPSRGQRSTLPIGYERKSEPQYTCAPSNTSTTKGEVLLTPTRLYVRSLLPILKGGFVKGCAHITGGGIKENAIRVLDPNSFFALEVDLASWEKPEIFNWLCAMGPVETKTMLPNKVLHELRGPKGVDEFC